MDLATFENIETIRTTFGETECNIALLNRVSSYIDKLPLEDLTKLIYYLYGQWPSNKDKDVLINGAKRKIQTKIYKDLYQKEPNVDMVKRDADIKERLVLRDTPSTTTLEELTKKASDATQRRKLKKKLKILREVENIKNGIIEVPATPLPKEPTRKKDISKESERIKASTVEELIQWALELGVPQDRINKHIGKSIGLAKMNIGNLIRGRLTSRN